MLTPSLTSVVAGVALDHDPAPVVAAALELAGRVAAPLDLVHGYHLGERVLAAYEGRGFDRDAVRADHVAGLRRRIWETLSALGTPSPVGIHVVPGDPAEELAALGAREPASLLVVGASHGGPTARASLGSVALRLVHLAASPVLVVRGELRGGPRRVLFTTDLSPLSARVHARGRALVDALALPRAARLRHLVVAAAPTTGPVSLASLPLDEVADHELARFLAACGAAEAERAVRLGDPAAEIVAEAQGWGAELVVVGTHSRGGALRPRLGSVADAVLARARCSVLVLPSEALAAEVPGRADAGLHAAARG